ncbi:MAG: PspA-associated protein PspAB, partial [Acidimicrobiales bacterium]
EGGICYKPAAGQPFAQTATEFRQLVSLDAEARVSESDDEYGYRWFVLQDGDFQSLVNEVHLVNTTLQEQGYGPQLLCSVFGFRPKPSSGPAGAGAATPTPTGGAAATTPAGGAPATTFLVYLYKRGAFYPFVPLPGKERHDLEGELRLQQVLAEDLKIEPDKERWMPIWGLPVH